MEGWVLTQKRHAGHACGWTCVVPIEEPARFQAELAAHEDSCPWPEPPEPVETPVG